MDPGANNAHTFKNYSPQLDFHEHNIDITAVMHSLDPIDDVLQATAEKNEIDKRTNLGLSKVTVLNGNSTDSTTFANKQKMISDNEQRSKSHSPTAANKYTSCAKGELCDNFYFFAKNCIFYILYLVNS